MRERLTRERPHGGKWPGLFLFSFSEVQSSALKVRSRNSSARFPSSLVLHTTRPAPLRAAVPQLRGPARVLPPPPLSSSHTHFLSGSLDFVFLWLTLLSQTPGLLPRVIRRTRECLKHFLSPQHEQGTEEQDPSLSHVWASLSLFLQS